MTLARSTKVVTIAAGLLACSPKGYKVILPEKYVGWVEVSFGVEGTEALPERDGFLVLAIPPDGRVVTSSQIRTSPKRDEFYFSTATGLVPGEPNLAGWTVQSAESVKRGGDEVVLYLFFGTRDQYQAFKDLKDEHGNPIPGIRSPAG